MKEEKQLSWYEKVLAILKGGDEGKLKRFQKYSIKYCKAQISLREAEIEEEQDKLSDWDDEFDLISTSIDTSAITTTEQTKEYVEEYIKGLTSLSKVKKECEVKIQNTTSEIEVYENVLNRLK